MFHARESDTSTGSGFLVDRAGDVRRLRTVIVVLGTRTVPAQ